MILLKSGVSQKSIMCFRFCQAHTYVIFAVLRLSKLVDQ